MTFPLGIDFRSTSGYVTDPTNCFFSDGDTYSYPHTDANGNVWGWETLPGYQANRSAYTGDEAKLAGIVYGPSGGSSGYPFRIDLPSTGSYQFRLGIGDAGGSNTGGPVPVYDTSTLLATLVTEHDAMTSNTFYDATDTLRTSDTDWVTNNALSASQTFSTTICRLRFGTNTTGYWVAAHVWIQAASGGVTTINLAKGAYSYLGKASPLSVMLNLGLGAYSYAGKALEIPHLVQLAKGAYTYAGKSSPASTSINLMKGAYAYSGKSSPISISLALKKGAYAYAGLPAGTTTAINLKKGAYTYAGKAASLPIVINLSKGVYTYAGKAAPPAVSIALKKGVYSYFGVFVQIPGTETAGNLIGFKPSHWHYH